jgi:hypothetical protein
VSRKSKAPGSKDEDSPESTASKLVEACSLEEAAEYAAGKEEHWRQVRTLIDAPATKPLTPPAPPPHGGHQRIKEVIERARRGDRHAALELWTEAKPYLLDHLPLPDPLADYFVLIADRLLGDLPEDVDERKAAALYETLWGLEEKRKAATGERAATIREEITRQTVELSAIADRINARNDALPNWKLKGEVGRRSAAFALRKAQSYPEAREIFSRILPIPDPDQLATALFLRRSQRGKASVSYLERNMLGDLLCRRVWKTVRSQGVGEGEAIEIVSKTFKAPRVSVERAWRRFKSNWSKRRKDIPNLFDTLLLDPE